MNYELLTVLMYFSYVVTQIIYSLIILLYSFLYFVAKILAYILVGKLNPTYLLIYLDFV